MDAASWLRAAWKESERRFAPEFGEPSGPVHKAAQAGTIISVVVIGVIALIGVLIFAQIEEALPADALYNDPTNETNPTALGQASEGVTTGFGNAIELVPIVLLVLVAAVVITVVQRMRGRGGLQ